MTPKKKLQSFLFIVINLFFFFTIKAQNTIVGTIVSMDKTPIEYANVTVTDTLTHELKVGAVSDQNGAFEIIFEPAENLQLSIQFIGYKNWLQPIANSKLINLGEIVLVENVNNLGEVVVTADKARIERKEDKLIFNIGNSPLNTGYDGIEILKRSPYIWVDGEDNILMRNQSAQIMINGRPLNLRGADLANYLRNINAENIKSVEIETTSSANSDASNLGGVVNIVLHKKPIGFNTTLRSYYQFNGDGFYQRSAGLNLNYGAKIWNVYGRYNFMQRFNSATVNSDIFYFESENYLETKRLHESDRKRHNYQTGFVVAPWAQHEFGAEFFGNTRNWDVANDSDLALTNFQDTLDFGITNTTNDGFTNVNALILNYTWQFDTLNSSLKFIVDRTEQKNKDLNKAYSIYNVGKFDDIEERNDFDNETKIFSTQVDLIKKFNNGFKTEIGAKYTNTDRKNNLLAEYFIDNVWNENDRTTSLTYQEKITAFYFNTSKKILENHFLKIGLRAENTDLSRIDLLDPDEISKNYTDWFPSVFYAYDLPKGGSISANYSRRLSRPAFYELNNNIRKTNDFRYAIGNPDLRPEYINLYEIKWQKKKHLASVYLHQANDAINGIYFLVDSIAYYQRQNNGSQTQIGLEYSLSGDLTKWWLLRGAVHLYHRKYTTGDGVDLFKKGTYDLRLSSNIKINSTTGIDFSARYLSPHADAFYLQDPYYYFEFFIRKSFFNKKLNCRLYFNDVFNTIISGNTRPFDTIRTTQKFKARTRTIRLWMTYYFSNQNKTSNKKNKSNGEFRRRL